ncbi:MAG TPA: hypothetical protein VJN89_01560 [Candidatus Acidoferrum sp.]|nr:hypothetical protein [Candidatus Acidoferrum sp.]
MRAYLVATLSLLAASPSQSPARLPFRDKQVIDYAKSIDVQTLDASLLSQRLEDWLQSGPPRAHIAFWEVADTCDLKPDPSKDYPLCAEIRFGRNGQWGIFLVQVGTNRDGIVGRPQVYGNISVFEGVFVLTGGSERLSDLPALLDQPVVTGGVEKMYHEVVAHHPIGIPAGAEMATLRPFLSKRLTEQIQTAQACKDDYTRQGPAVDRSPKPSWLTSGLFTGEGKHALPIDALVERKEKQSDGSFLVYVDLEYDYIDFGHGRRAFYGGHAWRVATRVISEEGQFVVDDVRVFDGLSTDGPSHLLSDSFTGCDGSHWTRNHDNP